MEDVLNILEIFASDVSTRDKIVKLDVVKKTIGSINFISPKNKNIEGISFVILNDKINSLGLVLKKSIETLHQMWNIHLIQVNQLMAYLILIRG